MKIEFQEYDFVSTLGENFVSVLGEMSPSHQILFAASICERTLPLYLSIDFKDNFNHQTFPILRKTLDYIWLEPAIGNFDRDKLQNLLDSCQKITADIEEYELCGTEESTAPYIIASTLELALTGEIAHLRLVVLGGRNVLWYALNYQMEREEELAGDNRWESKSLEERDRIIENHYLTKREMQKEMDDWIALKNTPLLTKEFIEQFRAAADPSGKGILDSYNPQSESL